MVVWVAAAIVGDGGGGGKRGSWFISGSPTDLDLFFLKMFMWSVWSVFRVERVALCVL